MSTLPVDLLQLRTFVVVAEERHLTRGAERLNMSQSSASAHVKAIEERLDTQLFIRANRRLELTESGQHLFPKAKALLNEAAVFTAFARELRGEVKGSLAIGVSGDPSSTRIAEVAARLRREHSLIDMHLDARPSSGVRQGLENGELDVGLSLAQPTHPDFQYHLLQNVRFRIAGPIAWKDMLEGASDMAELADLPWVVPSSNDMAGAIIQDRIFAARGLKVNAMIHFNNATLAHAMMREGVGLMLMREEFALRGKAEGYLALSSIEPDQMPLTLAHLSSRRGDPLIVAFLDAAQHIWPDMKSFPAATLHTA
ncbi:LysR family transcriptional regulator [Ottowia thiooxydans]|uniref:LysR family transcriptional regulator n=1 Tax=Ottowia thiooxydans TaxID=219182 RepID=UPI000423F967|nr:LysR family transcriptional regulator [Ottowia thiooxydans]